MLTETGKKSLVSEKALEVLIALSKRDQEAFFSVFLIDREIRDKISGLKLYPADVPSILAPLVKEGLVAEIKTIDDYGFTKTFYKANLENNV